VISTAIGRRYAKAIFELGQESGATDKIVADFHALAAAWSASDEFRDAIANPLVAYEAKKAIVRDIGDKLGISPLSKNAALFLTDRRRLDALPVIDACMQELAYAKKGLVRAEVLTAGPLSEDYQSKLRAELERVTGKKVTLDVKEDKSLLAGVVARIGDTVFDGSLRTRLQSLKGALLTS